MRSVNLSVGGRWSTPAAILLWLRAIGAFLELAVFVGFGSVLLFRVLS